MLNFNRTVATLVIMFFLYSFNLRAQEVLPCDCVEHYVNKAHALLIADKSTVGVGVANKITFLIVAGTSISWAFLGVGLTLTNVAVVLDIIGHRYKMVAGALGYVENPTELKDKKSERAFDTFKRKVAKRLEGCVKVANTFTDAAELKDSLLFKQVVLSIIHQKLNDSQGSFCYLNSENKIRLMWPGKVLAAVAQQIANDYNDQCLLNNEDELDDSLVVVENT